MYLISCLFVSHFICCHRIQFIILFFRTLWLLRADGWCCCSRWRCCDDVTALSIQQTRMNIVIPLTLHTNQVAVSSMPDEMVTLWIGNTRLTTFLYGTRRGYCIWEVLSDKIAILTPGEITITRCPRSTGDVAAARTSVFSSRSCRPPLVITISWRVPAETRAFWII